MKKQRLFLFTGQQGKMLATAYLIYQNYMVKQKDFAKINTKYTQQFGEDAIKAIDNARNEGTDVTVRRDIPKKVRNQLKKLRAICTGNWQFLAGYIEASFPKAHTIKPSLRPAWSALSLLSPSAAAPAQSHPQKGMLMSATA